MKPDDRDARCGFRKEERLQDNKRRIRSISRDSLKGKYGIAIIAGLITSFFGVSVTGLYFGLRTVYDGVNVFFAMRRLLSGGSLSSLSDIMGEYIKTWTIINAPSFTTVHWVLLLIVFVLVSIISLILVGGLTLGYAKMNLAITDRSGVHFRDLFSQMSRKRNFAGFKLVVFRGLLVSLGRIVGAAIGAITAIVVCSLLWILVRDQINDSLFWCILIFSTAGMLAGDIFVCLRYAFAPYVMCDDPEIKPTDALDRSAHLLDGYKNFMLSLVISFIGWFVLGIVTLGLASLWVRPYFESTIATSYRIALREKKINEPEESDRNDTVRADTSITGS